MDGQLPAGGPLPGDYAAQLSDSLGPASPSSPRLWVSKNPDPVCVPEDDFDLDAHVDWLVREIDEGRRRIPPESAIESPARTPSPTTS